jgi:hypothetical protein
MLLKKELTEYNRYQAFAVHMAISLIIFFILLVCITQYWYPGILFNAGNGLKAIGMIVGIDLILGPLLTLIVFNPLKSSLKMDLSVIALIQISALCYGSWTIYQTRPIALAYIHTSFVTIYANSKLSEGILEHIEKSDSNALFYVFNDSKEEITINSANFEPYDKHSNWVSQQFTGYRHENLIRIDPLMSVNRYIQINIENGEIEKFVIQ